MKRVAAPDRTRERLRALMDGRLGTAPDRSHLVLLAAQLIVEEALEAEVRDEVGRERYERAERRGEWLPERVSDGSDEDSGGKGPNRLGILLRSRHQVQQDLAPFLADAPGRENRLACLACPKPLGDAVHVEIDDPILAE